ncbi:hypothetical protein TNCV_2834891 [Trichonephila clavipes]|nr:hypothetical protein TNCV_2834891 [Trichonephila clavipes]
MWAYPAGSIRGTWNHPECHIQALATIAELQYRMRTGIWQLLPKEKDGAQYQTCSVSYLQLPVRQFQGRPCKDA